jgi:hypothetical protein
VSILSTCPVERVREGVPYPVRRLREGVPYPVKRVREGISSIEAINAILSEGQDRLEGLGGLDDGTGELDEALQTHKKDSDRSLK